MRAARAAIVPVVLAVLGACTTPAEAPGPAPTTPPPTTRAASDAPSPPSAIDRDDIEGAKAAAQHFLELYPYAYETGDLTAWEAMSHPECIFCASVVENVTSLHHAGGFQTGGEIEWLSIDARPTQGSSTAFSIDATAAQAPTSQTMDSEVTEISAGGTANLYIDVEWDGGWLVRGVNVETSEAG